MTLWYLMRGLGFGALAMLTLATTLGALSTGGSRVGGADQQTLDRRLLRQLLHRSTAVVGLVLLVLHLVTVVLDAWVPVSVGSVLLPFTAGYRPFALGLGTLALYAIVLMTAFNFFSHGTQDLYPTFLQVQHKFDPHTVSWIAITYNIGAIIGGLFFGAISERIGRRRAIIIAALIALPVLPLWAFSSGAVMLAIGAFLMQISVQGAWGVIPAHLNELSPDEIRATFPGLVYQLGNLLASVNGNLQASIAKAHGGNFGLAMALVAGTVAVVIAVMICFGRERRGVVLHTGEENTGAAGLPPGATATR